MSELVIAAQAIIYQRDFMAEKGVYDNATFRPDSEQAFDDWAADILEQALHTEKVLTTPPA